MRLPALIAVCLLLAGCSAPKGQRPPEPPPAVSPAAPAPTASPEAVKPDPGQVTREAIPGGFRIGPYDSVAPSYWVDTGRVYASFRSRQGEGLGLVSVAGGEITTLAQTRADFYFNQPVLDGTAALYSAPSGHWLLKRPAQEPTAVATGFLVSVSPDATRLVSYTRSGDRTFVDLRTGRSHRIEAESYYGNNLPDRWSPDGSRLLLQGQRTGPTPGFTFLDGDGQVTTTFTEPGFFSHRAEWSPSGTLVAFLSVPMETVYPRHPESILEPPLAPRLGVLDLQTGQTRYFPLADRLFEGPPLWSPDGTQIGIRGGRLATPQGTDAMVEQGSVWIVDLASGELRAITGADRPGYTTQPGSWSPDGRSLLLRGRAGDSPTNEYLIAGTGGGPVVHLPGEALWASADRLVVRAGRPGAERLLLVSREGKELQELAAGRMIHFLLLSPDRRWLAFANDTGTGPMLAGDQPSVYLTLIQLDP